MDRARDLSDLARQIILVALGVAVVVDAMVSPARPVQWIAGLVLLGIVPVDALLARLRRRNGPD